MVQEKVMENLILLAYILPSLILGGGLLGLRLVRGSLSPKMLAGFSLGHGLWHLGLSLWVLLALPLPHYFMESRYLFIDRLGIFQVLIASAVFILAALYSRGYVSHLISNKELDTENLPVFYLGFNLLLSVITFAFFANNLALFWLFLELSTLFSALLIATLNARDNLVAALKYIFIASTAMIFAFIGLIILFSLTRQVSGTGTLNWDELAGLAPLLSPSVLGLSALLILTGLLAKSGLVPLHNWLPAAYAKAPSVVTALMSATVLNIGIVGILRLSALLRQSQIGETFSNVLIGLGILSIGVAAFSMLSRRNLKKLIGFSSIEHMGIMLLAIGIGTPLAVFWMLFHTLAHSLVKSGLFFSAGIIRRQYGSDRFDRIFDIFRLQPVAAWGVIIGSAAITGMPLFPVFLSELNILIQLGGISVWLVLAVLFCLLLVASSFATFLLKAFTRSEQTADRPVFRTPLSMKLPVYIIMAGVVILGVFQPPVLADFLSQIVKGLGF
nr:proton-conducting transporter membrane subunit [Dehalococcoides mccartyi]